MCTVNFTNKYWFDTTQGCCKHLVFLSNEENIQKCYCWEYGNLDQIARLSECINILVCYIEIF